MDSCAGAQPDRPDNYPTRGTRSGGTARSDSSAAPRSYRTGLPRPSLQSIPVLITSKSMDLGFTRDEETFRNEVRSWLDRNLPAEWRHRGVGGYREDDETEIQRDWQRRLYEGGWLKLAWPREAGGRAATPVMQAIYQEKMAKAGAPGILGRLGVSLLAPTLLVHGTEWQKETYLEKILSGELIFCQGFSEPDAGSDLAGLPAPPEPPPAPWSPHGP